MGHNFEFLTVSVYTLHPRSGSKNMYIYENMGYSYEGFTTAKRVQYNSSFIRYNDNDNNNNVVSRMYSTDGQSLCIMRKGIRFSFHSTLQFAQRMPCCEQALLMYQGTKPRVFVQQLLW
jgi:hypothetical protein